MTSMRGRNVVITLRVEPKDSGMPNDGLPDTNGPIISRINDMLADHTKHDEVIGWRVTSVLSGDRPDARTIGEVRRGD